MLKRKGFVAVLAAMVFLSLFCVIQIIRPNVEYQYEGAYDFEEGIPAENVMVRTGISLKPGVYYIEQEYETDRNLANNCTVIDGTVFEKGLLTNGEPLYSGLGTTGFHIWLFESTEQMGISVSYGGQGLLQTGNLTIKETNLLWTMLLTVFLFAGGLLMLCLTYGAYNASYPVAQEKKNVFFWVMVISLLASVPYLLGTNVSGADFTYHLLRIEGVKDGILSGNFPVRLEPEWLYGYGYANAIFYCNALLLLPATLRLLGFTVMTSYNLYAIGLNIATAWIAYYCFSRIFQNKKIGLLCSALYTLSIFRIFKLVITSAVGEGSAFTFLPLVLYGLYRIFTEDPKNKNYKTAWIPVAAGYAGLIQTHVLTCEITAFLTILICILCIRRIFIKETFWELAKGALAAGALSLWYLVPFLDYYLTQEMHIKYVSARTIQDRGLYLPQLLFHFWKTGNSSNAAERSMQSAQPIGVGVILSASLAFFAILWFSGKLRDKKQQGGTLALAKLSAILGGMLMLMSLHIFPWDSIQQLNQVTMALVSSIQFPNRFLGWGTAFLVTVFGYCIQYAHRSQRRRYYYGGIILALIGITTSGMYLLDHVIRDQQQFLLYNEEGMGVGYISGAEYLIEGTEEELLTYTEGATPGTGIVVDAYDKDYLQVTLSCTNTTREESYIELPLLYYKGYHAYASTMGEELAVEPGTNHVVRVLLPPAFAGEVEVRFVSPFYWRISEIITYLTALAFGGIYLWKKRRAKV